jgi:hypothetical protein
MKHVKKSVWDEGGRVIRICLIFQSGDVSLCFKRVRPVCCCTKKHRLMVLPSELLIQCYLYLSENTVLFHYKEQINSAVQCREVSLHIGPTVQNTHLSTPCDQTQFHNVAAFSKYSLHHVVKVKLQYGNVIKLWCLVSIRSLPRGVCAYRWSLDRPWAVQEVKVPRFHDNRHLTLIFLYQTVHFTETISDSLILNYQEAGWTPEPVWNFWGREKSLATTEALNPDLPTCMVVATLF